MQGKIFPSSFQFSILFDIFTKHIIVIDNLKIISVYQYNHINYYK